MYSNFSAENEQKKQKSKPFCGEKKITGWGPEMFHWVKLCLDRFTAQKEIIAEDEDETLRSVADALMCHKPNPEYFRMTKFLVDN